MNSHGSRLCAYSSKLVCLFLFYLTFHHTAPVNAQDNPDYDLNKNAIHFDFGLGPLVATTLNYERVLKVNESSSFQLRGRTGLLWGGVFFTEKDFLGIPLNVTALWGEGKGHFELTGGLALGIWR